MTNYNFEMIDYKKVKKALEDIGIYLKDNKGQFKRLDEIFFELNQKWKT